MVHAAFYRMYSRRGQRIAPLCNTRNEVYILYTSKFVQKKNVNRSSLLLCSSVPNRPQTRTSPWPGAWGDSAVDRILWCHFSTPSLLSIQ